MIQATCYVIGNSSLNDHVSEYFSYCLCSTDKNDRALSWKNIINVVKNDAFNWLVIDLNYILIQQLFPSKKAIKSFGKLFTVFGKQQSAVGIICMLATDYEIRMAVEKAKLRGIGLDYVQCPDEIPLVVKPSRNLIFWVESDHIHLQVINYHSIPAAGRKRCTNPPISDFTDTQCQPDPCETDYKSECKKLGSDFKAYMEELPNPPNIVDLFRKSLNSPGIMKHHGPVNIIYQNKEDFPLPFEYISPVQGYEEDQMYGFRNMVIHQSVCSYPAELRTSKTPLRFLLIDAAPREPIDVRIESDGQASIINLGGLGCVKREIDKIRSFLDNDKRPVEVLPIKTTDFEEDALVDRIYNWGEIHVVHFAGHSGIELGKEFIHLPLKNRPDHIVSASKFRKIISLDAPWLLFLSSCEIGRSEALFQIAKYIPLLIAHRWPVNDWEAYKFTQHFYDLMIRYNYNPAEALWRAKFMNTGMCSSWSSIFIAGEQLFRGETDA